jgi:hypothetical protein
MSQDKEKLLAILEKYRGEIYRDKEKAEREAVEAILDYMYGEER